MKLQKLGTQLLQIVLLTALILAIEITLLKRYLKRQNHKLSFLSTNEEISNIDNFGLKDFVQSTYMIEHSSKDRSSKFGIRLFLNYDY